MKEIINELDFLPDNAARKKYLISIIENPDLGRHELKRIACTILIEDNFIEKYYRNGVIKSIKDKISKTISLVLQKFKSLYKMR